MECCYYEWGWPVDFLSLDCFVFVYQDVHVGYYIYKEVL